MFFMPAIIDYQQTDLENKFDEIVNYDQLVK